MGIIIAQIITAILVVTIFGGVLFYRSDRALWPVLLFAIAFELPLSPLAFYGVRLPFDTWLTNQVGESAYLPLVKVLYAPLTEETAKLLPLLFPFVRRLWNRDDFVRLAVAIGIGFSLGEIGLVGHLVAVRDPTAAALPWYQLGGFINERFLVTICHAGFTVVALRAMGWRFPFGVLSAMTLHFLGNFPIYLASIQIGGFSKETYSVALSLWVTFFAMGCGILLIYFGAGDVQLGKAIFGEADCPSCGKRYPRPLFGLNLGPKRYEKCPHCGKWHLLA